MKISIVIVTKNRRKLLAECIQSLCTQSSKPDELLIIDNNSQDDTRTYLRSISKQLQFPLRVVTEKRSGYPFIYNRGIVEAKFPWIAFIDDDCVADKRWLSSARKSIQRYPKDAAIMGFSTTKYPDNIWSLTVDFNQQYWKKRGIRHNVIVDYEILDNKNILYRKQFLKEHHLKYDESRAMGDAGGSEDCDLGMQIWQAKGSAHYDPHMAVSHLDPTNITWHIKKIQAAVKSHASYENKWRNTRKIFFPHTPREKAFVRLLNYTRLRKLSVIKACALFLVVYGTYAYLKFLEWRVRSSNQTA